MPNKERAQHTYIPGKGWLSFGLLFIVFFLFTFFLLHFIHPEINYRQYPLSWYLSMDFGWLLRLGFIAFGVAEIMLGVFFFQRGYRGTAFYCLAGMGAVLSGILIIDHNNQATSLQEYLHNYGAALQFIGFPIVSLYLFVRLKIRWFKLLSLLSSLLTGFLFVQMLVKLSHLDTEYLAIYGLLQRLAILWIVGYTLVLLLLVPASNKMHT